MTLHATLLYNMQASTIMHELGHNLGLGHGGDSHNTNNKPNHLSVMNYTYQLNGLPTIGNREGDRYYSRFFRDNLACNLEDNVLQFGPESSVDLFVMDYSVGSSQPIDENAINEALGFGATGSDSVDFDCSGTIDSASYSKDLNFDGNHNILRDVDEWSLVNLLFNNSWSGNASGSRNTLNSIPPLPSKCNE